MGGSVAYANAMAEGFFASLEAELLDRCCCKTQNEAEAAIFDRIEGLYSTHRCHSAIAYHSPADFDVAIMNKTSRTVGYSRAVAAAYEPGARRPVDNRFRR